MKKLLDYGLPAFFFLLPWQTRWIFQTELIAGEPSQFAVLSIFGTEILLLLVMLASGQPNITKRTKVPRMLDVILLAVVAVTLVVSVQLSVSLVQYMHLVFATLLFFSLMDERVKMKRVMVGFAAGLVLPAVLGIVQFFTGTSAASTVFGLADRDAMRAGDAVIQSSEGYRYLRAYGSFSHPNVFGGFLAVGLLTLWGLWNKTKNASEKMMIMSAGLLFGAALLLTFSRSAWLGLILAFIVGTMVLKIKKTNVARILVVPVAILFIAGIFFASFSGSFGRPGSDAEFESRSISERTQQYEEYFPVVDGKWILGSGIGTYSFAYEDAQPNRSVWDYQPIHNVFLLVIAEVGILGALAVLAWSSSIDRINFSRFPNRDAVAAFMMGNVILVILFFDHYLWSSWVGLALVAYVMAMTVRLGEKG